MFYNLWPNTAPDITVRDNAFDRTAIPFYENITNSHNAYVTGAERLLPTNVTDKVLASMTYQKGALGTHYTPSGSVLINAGSQGAPASGLYHFTTTTNQTPEGTSIVDIGLHFPGVSTNAQPADSDFDGLADYAEDANGNGQKDATETDRFAMDTDRDGLTDYQELVLIGETVTDPLNPDTNGNGVNDADDDADGDLISNRGELALGTSPLDAYSLNKASNGNTVNKDAIFVAAAEMTAASGNSLARLQSPPVIGATTVTLTLLGASGSFQYDIYHTPDLNQPWNWPPYFIGAAGQTVFEVPKPAGPNAFFEAGSTGDWDGDGLSDGFEALVSHTAIDVPEPDTDGDGLSNAYEQFVSGTDWQTHTLTEAIIPASRRIVWKPGVPGGIPNRTTEHPVTADTTGTLDAQPAIQAAIDNCPPNEVVLLPAGKYRLDLPLTMKSDVTLRGAGQRSTILECHHIGAEAVIFKDPGFSDPINSSETPVSLTGGYTKGSTTVSTANNSWQTGDVILIDALEDNDLIDADGNSGRCTWCGRSQMVSGQTMIRSHNQLVEIVSSTPNSISFWPPLHSDCTPESSPQGIKLQPMIRMAGLESLSITNVVGATDTTVFSGAYKCWIKDCELAVSKRHHVWMFSSLWCEFRDSSFHHGFGADWSHPAYGPDRGYGFYIGYGSTACLVENNDFWKLSFPVAFEGGSSGNVVAYNFMTDIMNSVADTPKWALGNHASHPMMNLWEGNVLRAKVVMDTYFGSSSHNTLFRNRISNMVRNHCELPVQYNFVIDIWQKNRYHNIIGNVLGTVGIETSLDPTPNPYPQGGKFIYRLGYTDANDMDQAGNDITVASTIIRHGNWTASPRERCGMRAFPNTTCRRRFIGAASRLGGAAWPGPPSVRT